MDEPRPLQKSCAEKWKICPQHMLHTPAARFETAAPCVGWR